MAFDERNDFFVERKQLIIQMTKEPINLIFANMSDNDINPQECDYLPSNDHRTGNNISRVRIPALVFLKDKVEDVFEYSKLFQSYRKQVGTHLFANFEGKLGIVKTYLDSNHKYIVSKPKFISEVYPCFTFVGEEHQLCIGLRFSNNLKEGFRSFGRTADRQSPSGGVFDLMESFLEPHRLKSGINSSENRQLFASGEQHFAIYMCDGSRLIVEDDRYDVFKETAQTKVGEHSNRSLFQSGSLIIFSAALLLELSIATNSGRVDTNTVKKVIYEWKDIEKAGVLKPEEGVYQEWFTERGLHQSKEQVIFLGHNYSVHNSICWRLKLKSPKTEGKPTYARLSAPEGGRIVDIQDWDWGLAEIFWRHRYERLHEKVLFANKPEKYVQNKDFCFKIPDVGGNNPYYWQKKIMGVGINFNSWTVRHEYKYDNQKTVVVPPYFEHSLQLDAISDIKPFSQPLFPPIYKNSLYNYLPFKTRPNFLSNQLVEINGQLFKFGYKENTEEYLWKDPKRVTLYENKELDSEHRIGVDLMFYRKDNTIIGKKSLIYLELNSNQNISSEKISDQKPIDSSSVKSSESIDKTLPQNPINESKESEEKKEKPTENTETQ